MIWTLATVQFITLMCLAHNQHLIHLIFAAAKYKSKFNQQPATNYESIKWHCVIKYIIFIECMQCILQSSIWSCEMEMVMSSWRSNFHIAIEFDGKPKYIERNENYFISELVCFCNSLTISSTIFGEQKEKKIAFWLSHQLQKNV